MQLTQLRLDARNAQARRDLADPYDMHRTLVRAFVRDERERPPRFLWRLEPGQDWSRPTVLVQSDQPGDWTFLSDVQGYLAGSELPAAKAFEPGSLVDASARLRFRLAANPTVTRQSKRLGLIGEEAQLAWLERQGARHGFDVVAALVTGSDMLHGHRSGSRVSLRRVLFEGVLQVRDAKALRHALATGIGPGKAFGCGLLSLARSA